MAQKRNFLVTAFLLTLGLSFFVGHGWAQDWQKEWERVLAAAEREGQVNVAGPPGDAYRTALVETFQKRYPKVRIEFNGASSRDQIPRVVRERQAGVFNWDVYIGGAMSVLAALKPIGALDPLRPELILPEVLDNGKWHGGFDFGFVDSEGKLFLAFDGTLSEILYVNWDFVSPNELKSFKQLLEPKWAGKIVWDDPRQEGSGVNTALQLSLSYGEDFLRQLFAKQKIVFTLDRRQLTEWVVRGRYPVGFSLPTDQLKRFLEIGTGKNVKPLDDPSLVSGISTGFGAFGVFNRRPHPNATKVYVNWLLSKEGQSSWTLHSGGRNSRRVDVPQGDPALGIKPDGKYIAFQTEKMIPRRQALMKMARDLIPQ